MYPDNVPLIILNEVVKQSSWMKRCAGYSSAIHNSPCAEMVAYFNRVPCMTWLKKKKSMAWKTSHIRNVCQIISLYWCFNFLKSYSCHLIGIHLRIICSNSMPHSCGFLEKNWDIKMCCSPKPLYCNHTYFINLLLCY